MTKNIYLENVHDNSFGRCFFFYEVAEVKTAHACYGGQQPLVCCSKWAVFINHVTVAFSITVMWLRSALLLGFVGSKTTLSRAMVSNELLLRVTLILFRCMNEILCIYEYMS